MKYLLNCKGRTYEGQVLLFLIGIALAVALPQPTWGKRILAFFLAILIPVAGVAALILAFYGLGKILEASRMRSVMEKLDSALEAFGFFLEWGSRIFIVLFFGFLGALAGMFLAGGLWTPVGAILGAAASSVWQYYLKRKPPSF